MTRFEKPPWYVLVVHVSFIEISRAILQLDDLRTKSTYPSIAIFYNQGIA
jgi:hypothetical protein